MFDFEVRLREDVHLRALLAHYAQLGSEDRTVWQNRLMRLDGVAPEELTVLHGELIALDAIEQNTGGARWLPDGILSMCYRVTRHGLAEYRRQQGIRAEENPAEPAEMHPLRAVRRKKQTHDTSDREAGQSE